ncbi:MAG: chromate transporter [Ruminococcaceae bacterium]|nr:chromate transporter [Oscillospiraceae bacterium]
MKKASLLWQVFLTFFKIGAFTFGGGYAMVPLIQREASEKHGWVSDEDILDIVAIAESTPGPIAINSATFVGYRACGIPGSVCATLGVVLPSFLIILTISGILREFQENVYVQYAFRGIRCGVLALILKAMWGMYKKCKKNIPAYIVMVAAFVLVAFVKVPVFWVIAGCAVFGIVTFYAMEKEGKK